MVAYGMALVILAARRYGDVALRVNTSLTANGYHLVDSIAVSASPMRVEHARNARRREDKSVGSLHVASVLIAVAIRVVIVDKGDGIAVVVMMMNHARWAPCGLILYPRHITKVVLGQSVVESRIFSGIVEGHALLACCHDPCRYGVVTAVPIFAYGEVRLRSFVEEANVLAIIAFTEVVTPTVVTILTMQPVEVSLNVLLYVSGGVVEVACTVPILPRIFCPFCRAIP